MPSLLYADDLVLFGESEEDLRTMAGHFVEECRRCMKVNKGKSKVIVLGGEERLECEVCIDGMQLAHVSEFKYLGCVLDKSGTDEAEYHRRMASGRRVAGAIRSLVNGRNLHLEYAMVLLMPVLTYGSETMIWKKKERSKIRAVQMNNFRGLLGIRRMDEVPNV